MSTNNIFGSWNDPPAEGLVDPVSILWHKLAAQNVGTPYQVNNFGLTQRRSEWTMLADLYLRARPKIVVEIGVAQSGTAAGWCMLGQPGAEIVFIDRDLQDSRPRPGDPVDPVIYSGPLKMANQGGGVFHLAQRGQKIHGISGWSYDEHVFSQLKAILGERKIDWLWTDSSHEEKMFAQEFAMYYPLVAEGGVYATHDIQPSSHPDVTKSKEWERIKREEAYSMLMEFRGPPTSDSYGIGVLIR